MKYLREEPFVMATGKPFEIEDADEGMKKHEAGVGEFLKIVLNLYKPKTGKMLETTGDLRSLNKAVDVLEGEAHDIVGDDQFWAFEDDHWKILRRVVQWVVPMVNFCRVAPDIEDLLDKATDRLPKPKKAPKAGKNGRKEETRAHEAAGVS